MYRSQSDKERFCRHYTVKREHALPIKIMATTFFPGFAQFFALFVLFRKTILSTHKTVDNKASDQFLLYSHSTLFRNKAANSGHSRAPQPNCSDAGFVEKTNQNHTCCFGILHGTICHMCPLRNNVNKG